MTTTPKTFSHDEQALKSWQDVIGRRLPTLSKPVATVLALFSFGILAARKSGRGSVALALSLIMNRSAASIEQRLYEWMVDVRHKSGKQRKDWHPEMFFASLLGWIVSIWSGKRLVLILDASTLTNQLVILCISVGYGQFALPVAWKVVAAQERGEWNVFWGRLLELLNPAIPNDWHVLMLADRGLFSKTLFSKAVALGLHPFMRLNGEAYFVPKSKRFRKRVHYIKDMKALQEECRCLQGMAFSTPKKHLACTLLCLYDEHYRDPWYIVTDLPTSFAQLYGMRGWIEQMFKCVKSAGFDWETSRVRQPDRAERQWLAISVAMLWLVTIGANAERLASIPSIHLAAPQAHRVFRFFTLGLALFHHVINLAVRALTLNLPPFPWPKPRFAS